MPGAATTALTAQCGSTTAFGGEVDDGTLVYLLVKPLRRWTVVLSKYVVALLSTFAVALPTIALPWLVLRGPELPGRVALAYIGAAGIAAAIYCAAFMLLGLSNKRALVIGLLYVIGLEGILSRSMAGVRSISVREYAISIAQAMSAGTISAPGALSLSTVEWMGTIIFVGAMVWTIRRLGRYEMAERL